MENKNPLLERQKELQKTGLCNFSDFTPLKNYKFQDFTFKFNMSNEAKKLLERAYNHFNLKLNQLERIEKITLAILKLEKCNIAEVYHIAEAIQYIK